MPLATLAGRYHGISPSEEVAVVTDLLIRDVPEEVVAAIDAKARRVGVSRTEYLRRTLQRESVTVDEEVTVGDLARFSETFADLADDEIMRQAWE
jgi:hypothetical protein